MSSCVKAVKLVNCFRLNPTVLSSELTLCLTVWQLAGALGLKDKLRGNAMPLVGRTDHSSTLLSSGRGELWGSGWFWGAGK